MSLSLNKLQCITWNLFPQSAAASRTLSSLRKGHGCIDQISWQLFQHCHYMSVWTENVIDLVTKLSSGRSIYLQKKVRDNPSTFLFFYLFHRKNWIQSGTGAMYLHSRVLLRVWMCAQHFMKIHSAVIVIFLFLAKVVNELADGQIDRLKYAPQATPGRCLKRDKTSGEVIKQEMLL